VEVKRHCRLLAKVTAEQQHRAAAAYAPMQSVLSQCARVHVTWQGAGALLVCWQMRDLQ
jgi:hypothetical protein